MGKVTGFLEYDRQEQKYQLAGVRFDLSSHGWPVDGDKGV